MNQENKHRNYELAEKLFSEQNFAAAIIAGAVATLLAASAYGIIVALWNFSYGFAAAGIGIAVGIPMQNLGRGITMKFAIAASAYTVAGCVLGNFFRVIVTLAKGTSASPIDVLRNNSLLVLTERAVSNISLIDLVFWFVAIFAAVFLVKRPLSRAERLAIGIYELKS